MASIKERLAAARDGGTKAQQTMATAARNAKILATTSLTEINTGKATSRNVLDRYKKYLDGVPVPQQQLYKSVGYKWTNADRDAYLAEKVYSETLGFYNENARTAVLKTMINRVASKVLDNYELLDKDGQPVDLVTMDLGGLQTAYAMSKRTNKNAIKSLMLGAKIYLVAYVNEDGDVYLQVKKRYEVRDNITGYDILYTMDGHNRIERRMTDIETGRGTIITLQEDKQGNYVEVYEKPSQFDALENHGVYELSIDQFVNRGTLELTLMYSQLYGTVDKELVLGALNLFADRGYNSRALANLQDLYTPVETPNTGTSLGEGGKPIFEVYSPTLRSADLETLRSLLRDEIATSVLLDKASIGLDTGTETATAERIKFSSTVDTINMLKAEVQEELNAFVASFLSPDYHIVIKSYQINDTETRVTTAAKAKQAGIMSLYASVKYVNQELDEDGIMLEVVRIKMDNMAQLTPAEEEVAMANGLILEQEDIF